MENLYDKIHKVHIELRERWRRKHLKKCDECRDYYEYTLLCRFCRKKLCYECSFIKVVVCKQCHIDRIIINTIKK